MNRAGLVEKILKACPVFFCSGQRSQKMNDTIEKFRKELPPAFSRSAVTKLFPGIIAQQTLANLACQNAGPPCFNVGRKCCYDRDSFIDWLQVRISELNQ